MLVNYSTRAISLRVANLNWEIHCVLSYQFSLLPSSIGPMITVQPVGNWCGVVWSKILNLNKISCHLPLLLDIPFSMLREAAHYHVPFVLDASTFVGALSPQSLQLSHSDF